MSRLIYERDTDDVFERAMLDGEACGQHLLNRVCGSSATRVASIQRQRPHVRCPGSIDLWIRTECGINLLIENKIDARYSVTRDGSVQPDRYRQSVERLGLEGKRAYCVLLAPAIYLKGNRHTAKFDFAVDYESLLPHLAGADRSVIERAISQASSPYVAERDVMTSSFFAAYEALAKSMFPKLVVKRNPNGNSERPSNSRTVYFDIDRVLVRHPGTSRLSMSLQCRDSGAASPSVKIMMGGGGRHANRLQPPASLRDIGGYLRPAGMSLGVVVNTPWLDPQTEFEAQKDDVITGLRQAIRLRRWWNENHQAVQDWCTAIEKF